MNKHFKYTVYLMLSYQLCVAGNEVGNGGDAVICNNKAELLDLYEARKIENYKLASFSGDEKAILQNVIQRLSRIDTNLANTYKKRVDSFYKEVNFVDDVKLVNIEDSNHLTEPLSKDCELIQAAVFKKKDKPNYSFIIDNSVWLKLDNTNKAGLVLHEVIYEQLYYAGEKDSAKTRQIVGLLFSEKIEKISTDDFWIFLQKLKAPIYRK